MEPLSFVLGLALSLPVGALAVGLTWNGQQWKKRAQLHEGNLRQLHGDVTRLDGDLSDALARAHGAEESLRITSAAQEKSQADLAETRKEAARLTADLAEIRKGSARLTADVASRGAEIERLEADVARLRREITSEANARRAAEGSLRSCEAQLQATTLERSTLATRVQALAHARDQVAQRIAALESELGAARRVLHTIGLPLAEKPDSPVAIARRGQTRALVSELAVDCDAVATALVDRRGLPLFGSGSTEAVGRLGTAGALFAEVEGSFGAVLCAPITTLSIATPFRGHHVVTVPGLPMLLAVESRPEAPLFALRHAAIRLAGHAPATPTKLGRVPAGTAPGERSPGLTELVRDWARRWSADAVGLVDGDGAVAAVNDDGLSGALAQARTSASGVLRRLSRDRWRLDEVEIRARTADDAVLALRLRDDDPEGLGIVAIASHPIPTPALDELVASLRWAARSDLRRAS